MAPLSVHSPGRGTRSVMPASSQRSAARERSRELAATPPPTMRWETPLRWQAWIALRVSTSAASFQEAVEGEVQRAVVVLGAGEADRLRVALAGGLVDGRAAGERHAEHPRHLVVGLAGRGVHGGAERDYVLG